MVNLKLVVTKTLTKNHHLKCLLAIIKEETICSIVKLIIIKIIIIILVIIWILANKLLLQQIGPNIRNKKINKLMRYSYTLKTILSMINTLLFIIKIKLQKGIINSLKK